MEDIVIMIISNYETPNARLWLHTRISFNWRGGPSPRQEQRPCRSWRYELVMKLNTCVLAFAMSLATFIL